MRAPPPHELVREPIKQSVKLVGEPSKGTGKPGTSQSTGAPCASRHPGEER